MNIWLRLPRIAARSVGSRELFTPRSGRLFSLGCLIIVFLLPACAQDKWSEEEITSVFDGIDLTAALNKLEAKDVTPYDFGFDLLRKGHKDRAKTWYSAMSTKTDDPKYAYALAWVEWATGNSAAALDDCKYVLAKNPTPLIKARTYYLLGTVNVDEFNFEAARKSLNAGLDLYRELGKVGGQYLCTSMLALCAVYEGEFHEVEPLLDKAEQLRQPVSKIYSGGRYHEILSLMRYEQNDFAGALIAAQDSVAAYRESEEYHLADEVEAKVGFLLLVNGQPKAAKATANRIWEKHHKKRSSGHLLAVNAITLMKISLCSDHFDDAESKEKSVRAWAKAGPGGKAVLKILNWTKDENEFPCPEWR